MDLSQFKQQDSFEYTLVAPNGDKLDTKFTLAGPTHPARSAFDKRQQGQMTRSYNKHGKLTIPDDPDDQKQRVVDRLVTCTLGWDNLLIDGLRVEFDAKASRQLFADDYYAWVRNAVVGALDNAELFTKSSSPG